MMREGQVRIPAGCAISGIISHDGSDIGGEDIVRSIAVMHDRSNGLGGGFAGCIQCLVPISGYEGFRAAMDGYYGEGACFELRIRGCGAYRIPEEE